MSVETILIHAFQLLQSAPDWISDIMRQSSTFCPYKFPVLAPDKALQDNATILKVILSTHNN